MAGREVNLTPKQLHFCRAVVSGCTMSDAYREAYNTSNMKPASIHREASLLMSNPMVTQRVERLQRQKDRALIASSLSDRECVLEKLRDMTDNAKSESVQLQAAVALGKTVALFTDVRVEEKPQRSPKEIQAELNELLEKCGLKIVSDVDADEKPDDSPDTPFQ
jgi:hypothetical protein